MHILHHLTKKPIPSYDLDNLTSVVDYTSINKDVVDCVSFSPYPAEGLRYVKKINVETQHPEHFYVR